MESRLCCNLFPSYHIGAAFCTGSINTTVVSCEKYCDDHSVGISVGADSGFHRVWILWGMS